MANCNTLGLPTPTVLLTQGKLECSKLSMSLERVDPFGSNYFMTQATKLNFNILMFER